MGILIRNENYTEMLQNNGASLFFTIKLYALTISFYLCIYENNSSFYIVSLRLLAFCGQRTTYFMRGA